MKKFKNIFFTAAASIASVSLVTFTVQSNVMAAEYTVEDDLPFYDDYFYDFYSGDVKAIMVRVGFSDNPLDESNPTYGFLSDEYLRSLIEGSEEGLDLPFNGLSDFLYKSSYGKTTMSVGDIVDIQLDGTYESYCTEDGFFELQAFNEMTGEYIIDEFTDKLYEQIDLSDYGNDINALYIWPVIQEKKTPAPPHSYEVRQQFISRCVVMNDPVRFMIDGKETTLSILIHETGHMFGATDYYDFDTYPGGSRSDIGNIMGYAPYNEISDYDSWIKWMQRWLTKDNVIGIAPEDGETGRIELTPFDSDTDEGKKIALFKYGDGYIAADFSGGYNNNNFDTELRKRGFRFIKINKFTDVVEIIHGFNTDPETGETLSSYQLFAEGDKIEDLLYERDGESLKITNIETGETPSFVYSYAKDNTQEVQENEREYFLNVKVVDEEGTNITNETSMRMRLPEISDASYTYSTNGTSKMFYIDEEIEDAVLEINSSDEGYTTVPPMHFRITGDMITTDSENVLSIEKDPVIEESYNITIERRKGDPDIFYNVMLMDEEGSLLFDEMRKIDMRFYSADSVEYEKRAANGFHLSEKYSDDLNIDTVLKFDPESIPEGYKKIPDIVFSHRGKTVTTESPYVGEIINNGDGIIIINLILQKDSGGGDPETPADDSSDNGNESTDTTDNNSDTGEQPSEPGEESAGSEDTETKPDTADSDQGEQPADPGNPSGDNNTTNTDNTNDINKTDNPNNADNPNKTDNTNNADNPNKTDNVNNADNPNKTDNVNNADNPNKSYNISSANKTNKPDNTNNTIDEKNTNRTNKISPTINGENTSIANSNIAQKADAPKTGESGTPVWVISAGASATAAAIAGIIVYRRNRISRR